MKRGQVTAFLIIGLIVLVGVGSYFYIKNYVLKTAIERELESASTLPEKIRPISSYLSSCIQRNAQEALQQMSTQSGYLTIPQDPLPITPLNPFSNSLEIFPGLKVPYWFYETSNGIQKSPIPSIIQMQSQIANVVTSNFDSCLSNITSFTNQGFSFTFATNTSTKVQIQDTKILIEVTAPIGIEADSQTYRIDKHAAKIDNSFGKLYNSAKTILDTINKNNFFEVKTIDMLAVYPEIPYSGVDFSCNQKFWSKQEIIKNLKPILSANVAQTILQGSSSTLVKDDYKYFNLNAGNLATEASFTYSPSWPLSLDVVPSEGDILKSDIASKKITDTMAEFAVSALCINAYNFVYDIKYPILITLNDENGFFQFSTMVVIHRNQPKIATIVPEEYEQNPSICDTKAVETTIFTKTLDDNGNTVDLPGTTISYKCISSSCPIGTSDTSASITENFPPCINGFVVAEKEGYHMTKQMLSTNYPSSTTLILLPYYDKQVNIKIIDKETGVARTPSSTEQVIFTFTNLDNEYSTTYIYPSENKLRLIPGNYEITSHVVKNSSSPIKIAAQPIEKCVSTPGTSLIGIFINQEKCFNTEIPALELNQVLIGGAKFEFEITQNLLISKSPLTLYTMTDKIPSQQADLTKIYDTLDDNSLHPYFKYPE